LKTGWFFSDQIDFSFHPEKANKKAFSKQKTSQAEKNHKLFLSHRIKKLFLKQSVEILS